MKKIFSAWIFIVCTLLLVSCNDNSDSDSGLGGNVWSFNGGKSVKAGSVLIYASAGQVKAFVSAEPGLVTIFDFTNAQDCTEISLPASLIGSEIDLANLSDADDDIYFSSRLAEFGRKMGLLIDAANANVTSGSISSSREGSNLVIDCQFVTTDNVKFSMHLDAPLNIETTEATEDYLDYTVNSRNIDKSVDFRTAFYLKNTWNDGWTMTYCVAGIRNYIQVDANTFVEIYTGSSDLRNGQPFNVAQTNLPFSLKFEYLDLEQQRTVPVTIDNTNRAGASGTVTLTKNNQGVYDAEFDITLNNGDIKFKGFYGGEMLNRNMIYSNTQGNVAVVRSATIDISSDPVVLYLSSKAGTAGPSQYDIKCTVEKEEWRYGKYMAFSGQGAKVSWVDGVTYDRDSWQTSDVAGGNWRVSEPVNVANGVVASECNITLYSTANSFAYYYGEIKVIK